MEVSSPSRFAEDLEALEGSLRRWRQRDRACRYEERVSRSRDQVSNGQCRERRHVGSTYCWPLLCSHPPTYYLPPEDVQMSLLKRNNRHTFCEWKGSATYYDFRPSSGGDTIKSRIWTYESPTDRFKAIKDYVSFYAGPWKCYVDGEEVKAQPGDFYGGRLIAAHTRMPPC